MSAADKVEVREVDIASLKVDAIVNAGSYLLLYFLSSTNFLTRSLKCDLDI